MNDSGDYKTDRDVAAVYWLYGLLRDLLSMYFSEPRLPEDENMKKAYSLLVASINEVISKRGMEPVKTACYIPFRTLYARPGISPDEWNGAYRPRVDDAYGRIESLYYAARAIPLGELDEIEDLAEGVKKLLKKYRKEKEKLKKKRAGELVKVLDESIAAAGRTTARKVERSGRVAIKEDVRTPLIKKIVIGVIIGVIATVIGRLIVHFIVGG
ncbi:MAG: hypothetical protein JSW52_00740 [Candidatus Coatesbacteria bacterium]|nr:MAG: hypothetical protein JSW52_00740 [Candidatus Coatesbacteria bacterium]